MRRMIAAALSVALAASAFTLSSRPASANLLPPVYHAAPLGAAWPAWSVMGAVVGIMVRAAYVYNTECRELTLDEAITGMAPMAVEPSRVALLTSEPK